MHPQRKDRKIPNVVVLVVIIVDIIFQQLNQKKLINFFLPSIYLNHLLKVRTLNKAVFLMGCYLQNSQSTPDSKCHILGTVCSINMKFSMQYSF